MATKWAAWIPVSVLLALCAWFSLVLVASLADQSTTSAVVFSVVLAIVNTLIVGVVLWSWQRRKRRVVDVSIAEGAASLKGDNLTAWRCAFLAHALLILSAAAWLAVHAAWRQKTQIIVGSVALGALLLLAGSSLGLDALASQAGPGSKDTCVGVRVALGDDVDAPGDNGKRRKSWEARRPSFSLHEATAEDADAQGGYIPRRMTFTKPEVQMEAQARLRNAKLARANSALTSTLPRYSRWKPLFEDRTFGGSVSMDKRDSMRPLNSTDTPVMNMQPSLKSGTSMDDNSSVRSDDGETFGPGPIDLMYPVLSHEEDVSDVPSDDGSALTDVTG